MNFKVSIGNLKLGKDTAIINITSSLNCPAKKLNLCKVSQICYAAKAERLYKAVLPYRQAQEKQWESMSAAEIAIGITAIKHKTPIKYLRFSESGDFRNQFDVWKMSKIADLLAPAGIKVYGYTARKDLNFDNLSQNMTVNGSGFKVHNSFTAIPKTQAPSKEEVMCVGNCRNCHKCKERNGLQIVNHYH